ncbi:ferrous iron transport protein B [Thermodesulfobacterium sp. TA1]|uniref:ferrous iron transport protein B n=1 Tax=Thermodesulfobacterium sp. TA1 TaxID=2234087 RepID=UPI001231F30A|nr:ferrous iron transport protein B [Thermodesulfobacterium sp. TA1]QER42711.1 ferrous iron transport protein B [Thermodesulfobacterium sp. TA1]
MKTIRVALVGNPNVGKTSILNHLVRSNLKIGNWSGVTVEKKEGKTFFQDYEVYFIDLPGVYTLEQAVSEDEKVAVEFLLSGEYDVILNVVETPKIERDLYLTCQLLDLGKPMVLALNMIDEAQKLGISIDIERLSELLKVRVIKTIGRTGEGVKDLLPAVVEAYEKKTIPFQISYPQEIEERLKTLSFSEEEPLTKFERLRLLEKQYPELTDLIKDKRLSLTRGVAKEVVKRKLIPKENFTETLDRILLHPVFGFLFFFLIMYLFFKISFDFSKPIIDWIDGFLQDFLAPLCYQFLEGLGVSEFFRDFIANAFFGGVGVVLSFLPLVAVMYFFLTLLETSGYLPRVSFLMDRFTHKIGLHGQSVIPLILGLGCNVPAILATRTFQETKDKLLVMAMIPFISCPARLVVFSFFAFTFFQNPVGLIFGLYLLGIVFSVLTGFVLRKTLLKKELSHFVMDLPPYRMPAWKTVFNITKVYVKEFIYRAGTVIFAVSLLVWLLLNLPFGEKNIENTYAAKLGKALSYVLSPIGLGDWRISTSVVSGFLAREAILSNLGVIVSEEKEKAFERIDPKEKAKEQFLKLGEALKQSFASFLSFFPSSFSVEEEEVGLKERIKGLIDFRQALSLLVFVLIYNSCAATVITMAREGNLRFALGFLVYSFVLAWWISFLVFRLV